MSSWVRFVLFILVIATATEAFAKQKFVRHEDVVPNQYLVALENRSPKDIEKLSRKISKKYDGTILEIYQTAFGGFLVEMSEEAATRLSEDKEVSWIEENAIGFNESALSASRGTNITAGNGTFDLWHLDRLDERQPATQAMDNLYEYCQSGFGVVAYVMDTGIWNAHEEFGGRTVQGMDFSGEGAPFRQCNEIQFSHGTAVASLLGGNRNGVANKVDLFSLRANTCAGETSAAAQISALNWIINKTGLDLAPAFRTYPVNPYLGRKAVLNWSGFLTEGIGGRGALAGWSSDSIEVAIRDVVNSGIVVVASANNYNTNACTRAPAHMSFRNNANVTGSDTANGGQTRTDVTVGPSVISAGGTSWNGQDRRWYVNSIANFRDGGSNSGRCIDVWAPAGNIVIASNQATNQFAIHTGGTSFAAPIVSGMVARFLETYGTPNANTARDAYNWLNSWATVTTTGGAPLVNETRTPDGFDTPGPVGMVYYPKPHPTQGCRSRPVSITN